MDFDKRDFNNVVITGFNNYKDFFARGLTLISGLHRTSYETIDQIFVFNLGFDDDRRKFLNSLAKVTVLDFPSYLKENYYPEFLTPSLFAWKIYAMWAAKDLGKNILWLDAGIVPLKNIKPAFDIIADEGVLFYSLMEPNTNRRWTSPLALKLLNATEKETEALQIGANLFGYKSYSEYQPLIDESYNYSQVKAIMTGDKQNHRDDQSVYSILASRFDCKKYPFEIFGENRGILHDGQMFFAHRGRFSKLKGLKYSQTNDLSSKIKRKMVMNYYKSVILRIMRYFAGDVLKKLHLYSFLFKRFRG